MKSSNLTHEIKYTPKFIKGSIIAEAPTSIGAVVKGKCKIGYLSYIGTITEIYNTDIGRFCSLARNIIIGPTNHPTDRLSSHLFCFANKGPFGNSNDYQDWMRTPALESNRARVEIGNDVWIGANVTVMRGISIGDGAIIAAGSVVTKDIEPYTIVGGVPAKKIRDRFDKETTERLKTLKWFQYDFRKSVLPNLDVEKIEKTISTLETKINEGAVRRLVCRSYMIDSTGINEITS